MTSKLTGVYGTHHSVSNNPFSYGVITMYENAIEISTRPRTVNGWLILVQLTLFLSVFLTTTASILLQFILIYEGGSEEILAAMLILPLLPFGVKASILLGISLLLDNWRRPLDLPQIYNRHTGKLHFLEESPTCDFNWKNLGDIFNADARRRWFSPRCIVLKTLLWNSLVVEDYTVITTVNGITTHHQSLALVSKKFYPNSYIDTVVARFNVGYSGKYCGPLTNPVDWEHVRRYMRQEGPPRNAWDCSAPLLGKASWWDQLGICSAFGPGYINFWRKHPILSTVAHLLVPLTLPLSLLVATLAWLSELTAYEVFWPAEILQEAGPIIKAQPE